MFHFNLKILSYQRRPCISGHSPLNNNLMPRALNQRGKKSEEPAEGSGDCAVQESLVLKHSVWSQYWPFFSDQKKPRLALWALHWRVSDLIQLWRAIWVKQRSLLTPTLGKPSAADLDQPSGERHSCYTGRLWGGRPRRYQQHCQGI